MPLHFVLSQRGKRQLTSNGFIYNFLRECNGKVQWRCVEYSTQYKCKAIANTTTTSRTGTILQEEEHSTHAPDLGKLHARKIIAKAKKETKKSQVPTSQVIQQVLKDASTSAVAELPGIPSLTRTLTRARAAANPILATPASRQELDIPECYKKTYSGDDFLFYDAGKINDRYLIFTTERNLQCLSQCDTWMADGTFFTVPKIFAQLYTIHGIFHGKPLPLIYVLTPCRTEKMYKRILTVIKNSREDMQCIRMICDFELAFINAMDKIYPESAIHGCFFHFAQCVWRHVQKLGFAQQYGEDEAFNLHIRMLVALVFVPIDNVYDAFISSIESVYFEENKAQLKLMVDYFITTWIGNASKRGRCSSPRYALNSWNCYEVVMNDTPRTNNAVEGWHNGFNSRLQSAHASMGKFINALKSEQSSTEVILEQHNAGREIREIKRRKYRDYDARLKKVVESYNADTDILEYLRGLAHNIKL